MASGADSDAGGTIVGKALQKIADFYEAEVEATLSSLTAALEPILIVFLGFVVGFIVIAMMLPLVKVIEKLSSGGLD